MPLGWKLARSARGRRQALARWENEGGALGADVVLVVFDKKHADPFKNYVTSKDLSHGLEILVKD